MPSSSFSSQAPFFHAGVAFLDSSPPLLLLLPFLTPFLRRSCQFARGSWDRSHSGSNLKCKLRDLPCESGRVPFLGESFLIWPQGIPDAAYLQGSWGFFHEHRRETLTSILRTSGGEPQEQPLGLDQPTSDGVAHQAGRLANVQLLHEASTVGLDRLDAYTEERRDLFRRLSLGDELQDLPLACG